MGFSGCPNGAISPNWPENTTKARFFGCKLRDPVVPASVSLCNCVSVTHYFASIEVAISGAMGTFAASPIFPGCVQRGSGRSPALSSAGQFELSRRRADQHFRAASSFQIGQSPRGAPDGIEGPARRWRPATADVGDRTSRRGPANFPDQMAKKLTRASYRP
jgi:hypothetical protein